MSDLSSNKRFGFEVELNRPAIKQIIDNELELTQNFRVFEITNLGNMYLGEDGPPAYCILSENSNKQKGADFADQLNEFFQKKQIPVFTCIIYSANPIEIGIAYLNHQSYNKAFDLTDSDYIQGTNLPLLLRATAVLYAPNIFLRIAQKKVGSAAPKEELLEELMGRVEMQQKFSGQGKTINGKGSGIRQTIIADYLELSSIKNFPNTENELNAQFNDPNSSIRSALKNFRNTFLEIYTVYREEQKRNTDKVYHDSAPNHDLTNLEA